MSGDLAIDNAREQAIARLRGRLEDLEIQIRCPGPLPAARLGRASRGAGGILARIWAWVRLPRVERFRVCAHCGLVRDEDRARAGGVMQTCTGWIGEPYNRCMSAQYQLR